MIIFSMIVFGVIVFGRRCVSMLSDSLLMTILIFGTTGILDRLLSIFLDLLLFSSNTGLVDIRFLIDLATAFNKLLTSHIT